MTKKELIEEREQMLRYIHRLERERYHIRGLLMLEALDAWFAEDAEEEPFEEAVALPAAEVKVRGFAPMDK